MLEPNTEAIIRLVWARRLGLPDDALAELPDPAEPAEPLNGAGRRLNVPTPGADDWGVVRLWSTTVLIAPPAMLTALDRVSDDDLLRPQVLRQASARPDGRLPRRQQLVYADAYPRPSRTNRAELPLISRERADAGRAAADCPPDDRIGFELEALDAVFTLLDDTDDEHGTGGGDDRAPRPLAVAGYAETSGLLARLRVLVPPDRRRSGHAAVAAAAAIEDALDQGMILEGWVEEGQTAAVALSESMSMSETGCRIWSPEG